MVQRRKETFFLRIMVKEEEEEENEISNIEHNQITRQIEDIHFKRIKVY